MHSVGKRHVFKRTLQTDVQALFTDDHDLEAPTSQQAQGLPSEQHTTTSETLLYAESDYGTVWNVAQLQAQLDLDRAPEEDVTSYLPQMGSSNK